MTRRPQPMQQQPSDDFSGHPLPRLGHGLFTTGEWRFLATRLTLSDREMEVVKAVFDDLSNSGMAKHLGISIHTARTYLWRVYHKLSVRSRSALIIRVFWESRALPSDRRSE